MISTAKRAMIAMACAMLISTGLVTPATAAPALPAATTDEDEARSRAFLTEFGVDRQTQDKLIDDAKSGKLTLADNPESEPTSVEKFTRSGSNFEVNRFADGSISVVEREVPQKVDPDSITPLAVTGCTISGQGSYTLYSNCKVHYRTAVFSYGFFSTFTMNGSSSGIRSAHDQFHEYSVGHNRISWALKTIKSSGTQSSPAHVQLSIRYSIWPQVGEVTKGVRLKVGGSSYWQENS